MKIRSCFVSNSSSSSCVCDLCGRSETGWDMGAREAEMFNCENGHTICTEEAVEDLGTGFEKAEEEAKEKQNGGDQ